MTTEQLNVGQQVLGLFTKARRVQNGVKQLIETAQDEIHSGMAEHARLLGQGVLADLMAERIPGLAYDGVEELGSGLLLSKKKLEAGQAAESALPGLRSEIATQIHGLLEGAMVTATMMPDARLVFARRNVGHAALTSGLGVTHGLIRVTGKFIGVDKELSHFVVTHEDSDFEWVVSPLPRGTEEEPHISLQVERPGGESAI